MIDQEWRKNKQNDEKINRMITENSRRLKNPIKHERLSENIYFVVYLSLVFFTLAYEPTYVFFLQNWRMAGNVTKLLNESPIKQAKFMNEYLDPGLFFVYCLITFGHQTNIMTLILKTRQCQLMRGQKVH